MAAPLLGASRNFAVDARRYISRRGRFFHIIRRNTSIDASVKRKRHMAALNDDVRTTLIKGINKDAVDQIVFSLIKITNTHIFT